MIVNDLKLKLKDMKTLMIIGILVIGLQGVNGQPNSQSFRFGKEDLRYVSYNILSSSIISGIGAGFHKKQNQTFFQAFKQGVWKGAIGGLVISSGKELIRASSINNTYAYVWPARTLNSLGSSILQNGIQNNKILKSINMNVFFANVSFDGKVHIKLDPYTLGAGIVLSCNKDYNFDLATSVITGSIVFNKIYENTIHVGLFLSQVDNTTIEGKYNTTIEGKLGQNFGNCLYRNVFSKDAYRTATQIFPGLNLKAVEMKILMHEEIHAFQYENCYYFDLGVKHLYVNPYFGINYLINAINGYDHNLYEKEADHFSNMNF